MLYLHCGLMKTGTTSLRGVLAGHRDRLDDIGVVYAREWRVLTQMLRSREADIAIDEFKRFIGKHAGGNVLCSNEWLASVLWEDESREALVRLLAAAGEVMPVRCIWTLRRLDDLVVSTYLWLLAKGDSRHPIDRLDTFPWVEETITGIRRLEEAEVAGSTYLQYDPGGRHNVELLRAFGLPAGMVGAIEEELRGKSRLNVGPTHKQVVSMLNADALSVRSGVAMDRQALQDAFDRGGFRFEGDHPCVVADDRTRRALHERAMEAARQSGFTPYIRFFGDSEFAESAPLADFGAGALSDEDLGRLAAHVAQSTRLAA